MAPVLRSLVEEEEERKEKEISNCYFKDHNSKGKSAFHRVKLARMPYIPKKDPLVCIGQCLQAGGPLVFKQRVSDGGYFLVVNHQGVVVGSSSRAHD